MRYNFTDTFAQKSRHKRAQRIYLFCAREGAAAGGNSQGEKE
jgi:hypothetical protein